MRDLKRPIRLNVPTLYLGRYKLMMVHLSTFPNRIPRDFLITWSYILLRNLKHPIRLNEATLYLGIPIIICTRIMHRNHFRQKRSNGPTYDLNKLETL